MNKKLTFEKDKFKGVLLPREFTADILVEGQNVVGEPFVSLNTNEGLPYVKDYYVRWGKPMGKEEPSGVVLLTVRFEGEILENHKLKGALSVNLYVQGATNYLINWR